jgi:formate-dependent nitrite reductase cytochrome c552 subunit
MARFIFLLCLTCAPALAQTPEPTARELLAIINERSNAETTRIQVQEKANDQRFEAQEKAVAAALAAAKEAVTKAEAAAEKRFDSVNEFRGQLKDQAATLMPRTEVTALLKSVDEKTRDNEDKINRVIARSEGANWLWSTITGAMGVAIGFAGAFIALRKTVRGK